MLARVTYIRTFSEIQQNLLLTTFLRILCLGSMRSSLKQTAIVNNLNTYYLHAWRGVPNESKTKTCNTQNRSNM